MIHNKYSSDISEMRNNVIFTILLQDTIFFFVNSDTLTTFQTRTTLCDQEVQPGKFSGYYFGIHFCMYVWKFMENQ